MSKQLNHVHPDGFTEPVLAIKEYRTYPSGFYSDTRWALILRPRHLKKWELAPLSELIIENTDD